MELGFIDFSTEERSKIIQTLSRLSDKQALDELGLGIIRDAYADILFPGISTLQTRAKYFLIVPYLFNLAKETSVSSGEELESWIQKQEDDLVSILVQNSKGEEVGIFGKNSYGKGKSVKYKPSTIYWNGLRVFNIVTNKNISFSSACKLYYKMLSDRKKTDIYVGEDTTDDETAIYTGNKVLFSPIECRYTLTKDVSISLTKEEAKFLKNKIICSQKDTLLSFLLDDFISADKIESISFSELGKEWEMPSIVKNDYELAKDFADLVYIIHLFYNVILFKDDEKIVAKYKNYINDYTIITKERLEEILNRITISSNSVKDFIKNCYNFIIEKNEMGLKELIINREKHIKRERAKLGNSKYVPDNPIHDYKYDFRFNTARQIILDIKKGLRND